MIKLTLNPDDDPRIHSFDETEVIIGNHTSRFAHLKVDNSSLCDIHIKIIKEEGRFLVVNSANDPFASLNGLPFGKKTLKSGDLLHIDQHTFLFELSEPKEHPASLESEEKPKQETSKMPFHENLVEKNKRRSRNTNLTPVDIEALLQEVELLHAKPPLKEIATTEKTTSIPVPDTAKTEEDSFEAEAMEQTPEETQKIAHALPVEYGDSPPLPLTNMLKIPGAKTPAVAGTRSKVWNEGNEKQNNVIDGSLAQNWKMFVGVFITLVVLGIVVCSGVYFRASGKNSQEEKKLAAGVADIAMAITHAQLNHITTNKQNWADPEFISYNLACVLSPNLHTQAQIDAEGKFTRYPYLLRVYTSNDMSRFLVIAQPAPNLLQWLVHKKTIVVDSTSMEMRKITDLKELNRLLANPNPFEGQNGIEISRVVKEGSLMSLASLSGNKNQWGFIPPKALAYIRPGAENFIYNAPRYYPFGESFLRKAVGLTQSHVTSSEVSFLQEEMTQLSAFPELVLYTSQGLQSAIEAQKALAIFSPTSKFLVGYVKFTNKGYVASSHIFINDDSQEIALIDTSLISRDSLLKKSTPLTALDAEETSSSDTLNMAQQYDTVEDCFSEQPLVDTNHPLFLRLNAIASSRSRALSPLGEKISELVLLQNREMIPDFHLQVSGLISEYLETDEIHRKRMVRELAGLYQEYSEVPLEEFMKFIEASKLTSFVNEALKSQKNRMEDLSAAEKEIVNHISALKEVSSLGELDGTVQELANRLNLEQFPDPERLISLQGKMHNSVLDRLSMLLLSPESPYAKAKIDEHDRTTLIRILKTAWVNDGDEFDFFIRELDILKNVN